MLNDQDALVDLAEGVLATEIAMAIHGDARFRNQDIRVGCIIAGRENLITAEKERIETRMQKEELEREKQELLDRQKESKLTVQEESLRMKNEYANYQLQMNDLTARVQEQLSLLETVRKEIEGEVQKRRGKATLDTSMIGLINYQSFPCFQVRNPHPKMSVGLKLFCFR